MKTDIIRGLAALILMFVAAQATAIPSLKKVEASFSDGGNGTVFAGLIVEAETALSVLGVGGGWTITCSMNPALPLPEQRFTTVSSVLGPKVTVKIPEVVPSAYTVPNWSSIPAGSCSGQCKMDYTGEARDEANLTITIGWMGSGATFTLIPDGQQSFGSHKLINVCRSGRPQCCTPGCQLP